MINGSFFSQESSAHSSESNTNIVHEFDHLRISVLSQISDNFLGPPDSPSSSYPAGLKSAPSDVILRTCSADVNSKTDDTSSVHIISNTITPMCVQDNAQDSIHDETLITAEALTHKST